VVIPMSLPATLADRPRKQRQRLNIRSAR